MTTHTRIDNARVICAPHGTELSAKSWLTEAPLRMLMNNLDPENAEHPDDLVVYGGTGRAARSWEAFDAIVRTDSGPSFPLVRTAIVLSLVVVAGPYLTRPLRRAGAALVTVVSLAGLYLAVGTTEDLVGGLLVGYAAGKTVLLALRAPAGRPSVEQVDAALGELGIEVEDVRLAPERRQGATLLLATTPAGDPLSVKVLGRDQRDAQFLSKAWRWLTTKDSGPTLYLTRRQEVEHEAFVDLLAARGGVAVPEVVAATTAGPDAALLVERRPVGRTLDDLADDEATDEVLATVGGGATSFFQYEPSRRDVRSRSRRSGRKPLSWLIANRVPTWIPVAPRDCASLSRSGEPQPPASQNGRPRSRNFVGSTSSRAP